MKILSYNDINELLKLKLDSGEPFSLVRNCNTMSYVLGCYLDNEPPKDEAFNKKHLIEMGIYPLEGSYFYKVVIPETLKATSKADILGFVDCEKTLHLKKGIQNFVGIQPAFFGIDFEVLNPIALLLKDLPGLGSVYSDPWMSSLKNKKVLVISSHYESILSQWKHIDKVWGENLRNVAPFELAGVIRSPFHPLLDDRQYPNCNEWHQTVEYIKREMELVDFDVLLVGSAATAPLFAAHAKKMGKVGIHVGGSIQLFFGIKGFRWEKVEGYKQWVSFYNDSWIYPLPQDRMQKNSQMIESCMAYW
jgi:hypothetical protein